MTSSHSKTSVFALLHENDTAGVFKKTHSGDHFRKALFFSGGGGGEEGVRKTPFMSSGRKAKMEKKISVFKSIQMRVEEALIAFFDVQVPFGVIGLDVRVYNGHLNIDCREMATIGGLKQ